MQEAEIQAVESELNDLAIILRTAAKDYFITRMAQVVLKRLKPQQALVAIEKAKGKCKRFPSPSELVELAYDGDSTGVGKRAPTHFTMCEAVLSSGLRCNTMIRTKERWPSGQPCLCQGHRELGFPATERRVTYGDESGQPTDEDTTEQEQVFAKLCSNLMRGRKDGHIPALITAYLDDPAHRRWAEQRPSGDPSFSSMLDWLEHEWQVETKKQMRPTQANTVDRWEPVGRAVGPAVDLIGHEGNP